MGPIYRPMDYLTILGLGLITISVFGLLSVEAGQCTPFVEIPEEKYDRNYRDFRDDGARPLGFDKGDVPFNNPRKTSHCVTLTNMAGRSVEVTYETIPSMKLCVRDGSGRSDCNELRYYDCYPATSDVMTFEFYCDVAEGCSESDVDFWYRLVRGPPRELDTEMMWCHERQSEYPEDLVVRPGDIIPPLPTEPPPVGTAVRHSSTSSILLLTLTLTGITLASNYA